MTDIKGLLTQNENRKLEFKRELPSNDKITRTAIAFSNSQGGDLIIGVNDSKKVIGINEEDLGLFEESISNTIYDNCHPSIIPEIYSVRVDEKILLVIHFYPSNSKPHYIKSVGKHKGTIVRVGSSNRVATIEIIEELERQKRRIHFDSIINYNLEYNESSFVNFETYITSIMHKTPSISLYDKLGMIKKERDCYFLTNLGTLFHPDKRDYFPLVKIECARFKGTTPKVFLDQATFDGDIIRSIEESIGFIKRNIRLGATIGEVYRKNRWEYPLLALREVVINAVVHRDYSILGSDIKIAIFDDMIEVTSPGVFLIDKEKIGKGYSKLRNSSLGALFKRLDIIEQWGTGFEKVEKELEEYPELHFELDDESSFTQIRFVKKTTPKTTLKNSTKEKIIHAMIENSKITREELASSLGVSINAVKNHITSLKKADILERVGGRKDGFWKIKNLPNPKGILNDLL